MILLFGGTADTVPIANLLISLGHRVLISTLTESLDLSALDTRVQKRHGPLLLDDLEKFIGSHQFSLVIDATHPYAEVIQKNIEELSLKLQIPRLRFERPESSFEGFEVLFVEGHEEASKLIKKKGWQAFLTIGSRNLKSYVGLPAVARILDSESSFQEGLAAGFSEAHLIGKRGLFSLEENIEHLKKAQAQVLVTKDGGEAGQVLEKLMAAKALGLPTIVIKRPKREKTKCWASSYEELIKKLGDL